jgi:hypothetical protein
MQIVRGFKVGRGDSGSWRRNCEEQELYILVIDYTRGAMIDTVDRLSDKSLDQDIGGNCPPHPFRAL